MITAIGNPVYDLIQTPKIRTSTRVLSGCSTNAVLALSKLGEATRIVGAVGPDYRESFARDMRARGIETVIVDSPTTGGFSLDYYDNYGNRTLDLIDRASDIAQLDTAAYADSRATLIGPILGEVSFSLIREIRRNFTGLFFCDPQGLLRRADGAGRILHEKPMGIEEILGLFDVVKPNELEGRVLTGIDCRKDPHTAAKIIHSWGPRIVLLTLAELGAIVYDGHAFAEIPPDEISRPQDIPAYEVNLVDSTGAGDTSMAGFTFEYLRTGDPILSACFAGATSSIMIENVGPDFEMNEALIRARASRLLDKVRAGYRLALPQTLAS